MAKQLACAAAISSSGLVPFSFSNLVLKEYGVSASTPESVERVPLPARPVPRQTAFALRIIYVSLLFCGLKASRNSWLSLYASRHFHSRRLLQCCGVDGHLAQPLASRCKDCIGDCRHYGRSPGLTHSARWLRTLDDMHFNSRRLVHTQDLVLIEVGLLDAAVFQRDLPVERRRDAEVDRALDLRLDGIGIDDGAAIDRADDALHSNRSVLRHLDL